MKERCCKNCMYSEEVTKDLGIGSVTKRQICKKNPPNSNGFPEVDDLDWCYCFDEDRPVKKYEVAYEINGGQYAGFIYITTAKRVEQVKPRVFHVGGDFFEVPEDIEYIEETK